MIEARGKVAVVTGGGSGIGLRVAKDLLEEGASVCVADLAGEKLEKVQLDLARHGGRLLAVQRDVTEESGIRHCLEQVKERFGGLDWLVNNASVVGKIGPVEMLDEASWSEALRVNVTGPMLFSREAIPLMRERGGGSIVNVSSNVARRGFPNRAPYVCSKWALNGLTQTMAHEVAKYGIRVNAICPGPVLTERLKCSLRGMADARGVTAAEIEAEWRAQSPMNRFATAGECSATIRFLLSDASSGMTGQALNVTCGMMMT